MTKAVVPLESIGSLTTNLQHLQTCYNYTPTTNADDSSTYPLQISTCTSTCECHVDVLRQKFETETAPLKSFFNPEQYDEFVDQKIQRYKQTMDCGAEPELRVWAREVRRKIGGRMRFVRSEIEARLKRLNFKCGGIKI
ncbi:hypothetical protein B7494_g5693 [Chlorociboria aeruginascens]|nr:hypothetical protein B7494_g5693 [Chlorociboria aeruginascens]